MFNIKLCFQLTPEDTVKRCGEIYQIKMFNLRLLKNKSYYMNFKHKNKLEVYDSYDRFKVNVE